jgi:hypothetical protein
MCSWCEVTDSYCFCGTTKDPEGRTAPCGVRSDGYCSVCGHSSGSVPADTSEHGYDYAEYE